MSGYKLTIRHGPKVSRERHKSLEEAIEALHSHVDRVRRAGNLREISAFRTYGPEKRVNARLEISTGGFLRSRDAGIDVMGDGTLIPFQGGVRRKPLEPAPEVTAFDAVRDALQE